MTGFCEQGDESCDIMKKRINCVAFGCLVSFTKKTIKYGLPYNHEMKLRRLRTPESLNCSVWVDLMLSDSGFGWPAGLLNVLMLTKI
jgi:hypothetical protein